MPEPTQDTPPAERRDTAMLAAAARVGRALRIGYWSAYDESELPSSEAYESDVSTVLAEFYRMRRELGLPTPAE